MGINFRYIIGLLLLAEILVIRSDTWAQNTQVTLSKSQALEDFQWLKRSLEYVHPRLYKYETKASVDARFDTLTRQISQPIKGMDFLALVSRANAAVRCGHLYTIPQDELASEVLIKKVLPFQIKVLDKRMYLLNDCSANNIPNGSEILSINNKTSKEILSRIMPGIAADGYIESRKIQLMERGFFPLFQGFDLYFHLHVDRSEVFKIEYLAYGTSQKKSISIKGVSMTEKTQLLREKYDVDGQAWFKKPSPDFELKESANYAYVQLNRSFYDKTIDPDFDSLLHSAFRTIREKKIGNLVLDLRNNEGGSEYHQRQLMSYLYDKPFKLYENIYISHLDFRPLKPVIIERDTSSLVFNNDDGYMRKINESLWINNYEYDDNLKFSPPKEDVYTGKLYVLMNGATFSSAADLAADIKKTRQAIFIGQESGGTFEGPTGGSNIVVQLPNSKIMVRISPNIQTGFLYQKHPLGRGVIPEYLVKYSIEDVLAGIDKEIALAKSLISNNN